MTENAKAKQILVSCIEELELPKAVEILEKKDVTPIVVGVNENSEVAFEEPESNKASDFLISLDGLNYVGIEAHEILELEFEPDDLKKEVMIRLYKVLTHIPSE